MHRRARIAVRLAPADVLTLAFAHAGEGMGGLAGAPAGEDAADDLGQRARRRRGGRIGEIRHGGHSGLDPKRSSHPYMGRTH
jgi:hypothetical protein